MMDSDFEMKKARRKVHMKEYNQRAYRDEPPLRACPRCGWPVKEAWR